MVIFTTVVFVLATMAISILPYASVVKEFEDVPYLEPIVNVGGIIAMFIFCIGVALNVQSIIAWFPNALEITLAFLCVYALIGAGLACVMGSLLPIVLWPLIAVSLSD